jgi:hypothetical protein
MIHMKAILAASALFALAGCSDQYRYPCQDPAKMGLEKCSPQVCSLTDMCPDRIVEEESQPIHEVENKGDCK